MYSEAKESKSPQFIRPKRGMRVEVFNQVSNNFTGTIIALNRRTVRVRADKPVPFTNHPEARTDHEGEDYLVPYGDLRLPSPELVDNDSPKASVSPAKPKVPNK